MNNIELETGRVAAALLDNDHCDSLLLFVHGAGAGMRHEFMENAARALVAAGIATLRFQFPYMEKGRKAPDRQHLLTSSIAGAVRVANNICAGRPLFVGGKSMGGRMASIAVADGLIDSAVGLIFFGFPLHASGKPSQTRAAHLTDVDLPLLFLQGTRDRLASVAEIESVSRVLGDSVTVKFFDGADHSFRFLKSSGREADSVYPEIAAVVRHWCKEQTPVA